MLLNNLCSSCTNIGCEFQSGIVRTKCAFYMPPHIEPDNCGNYDVISRQAVLDIINFEDKWLLDAKGHNADTEIAFSGMKSRVSNLPSVNPQEPKWIPVKWHTITDEEREREGYPKEWVNHVDCVMPDDEQEILITVKGRKGNTWVEKDTNYIDDGFYLDSGYDWVEDVLAWMPLPKPYEPQESEE